MTNCMTADGFTLLIIKKINSSVSRERLFSSECMVHYRLHVNTTIDHAAV